MLKLKWLKYLVLFTVIVFLTYLVYLNNIVNYEFSKPIKLNNKLNTQELDIKDYPETLIKMLLIVEDRAFFKHNGFNLREIIKAIRDYVIYQKPLRGASTITQQLIKNTLLTKERTMKRKINEIFMALLLELSFDKQFILTRYMNTVYLGQKGNLAVYGFANAAKFYFNKDISLLSTKETATLIALVKGPSFYNPKRHKERLAKRTDLVLLLFNKYNNVVKLN